MMISCVFVLNLLFALAVGGVTRRTPPQLWKDTTDIPPDAMITLNREGLIVTIVADGRVMVEGQTFDFDISAIKMRISREQVLSLIDGFDRIDFFSLKTRYLDQADGCSSDGRTHCVLTIQTTSFTLNGRSKSVTRYPRECLEKDGSPYPRGLVALEHRIEDLVNLHKR